ncbi:MAG: tetratricopeptide repeat protein [bacterium]|nr:tetratricopeptide repeat protein [bacterium]
MNTDEQSSRDYADLAGDAPRNAVGPWLIVLVVAAATLTAFFPVLHAEFVNWDDDHNVVNNPHIRGLGWAELGWMFTAVHAGHYQPLTWVSLAVDYQLWGLERPGGFHLTSLMIHAFTAVAVYFLARQLLLQAFGGGSLGQSTAWPAHVEVAAGISALLFAVHPLRVESVAWVTERRDVLGGLFFVLSLYAYVRAVRMSPSGHPHTGWYAAAIGLCGLSLLCKAHAVTLVGVLVLLDVFPLRRFGHHRWRPLVGKLPFLLLSVAFSLRAFQAQDKAGAMYSLDQYDFVARVSQALYAHAFYLSKLVIPVSLGPLYELPERDVLVGSLCWIGLLSVLATVGVGLWLRRRFGWFLLAWGWYVVVLLPVSGFFQSGSQLTADRYTYLSCIGWTIALGALAGGAIVRGRSAWVFRLVVSVAVVVIVGFGALTWRQAGVWRDSVTLWQRGIAVSPDSAIAHTNLGDALMHTQEADPEAALECYERALALDPRDAKAHNGMAAAALAQDQPDRALQHLQTAVLLDPQYAHAHFNLGYILTGYSRFEEALIHYRAAARLAPKFSDAAAKLADLLIELGRHAEAVEVLRSALTHLPGRAYFHSTLSWLLATCPDEQIRDGDEALVHANEALRLSGGGDPWGLDSRAAALAELLRFPEAVAVARSAVSAAHARGLESLAEQIENRVALYQRGQPYRIGM